MKKVFGVLVLGLLMFSMFLSFAGASSLLTGQAIADDIDSSIDGIIETAAPILEKILGDTPDADWLFAKFLFALLILIVVVKVLGSISFFNKNSWVVWVVSISVSVLAVRWIEDVAMLQVMLLPYTTLGITIAMGIPFVIFFMVVTVGMRDNSPSVRRLAWLAFAIIFIGLWLSRLGDLGDAGYVYLVFAVAAFIMMKLDGTWQRAMDQMAIEKQLSVVDQVKYVDQLKQRRKLRETLLETDEEGMRGQLQASIHHIDNELKNLKVGAYRNMGKDHNKLFRNMYFFK